MSYDVLSVTFEKDAMRHRDGHFTIPKKICELINLAPGDQVHLIIRTVKGDFLYAGKWQMKSGYEIYGGELRERIKAGERIIVTVSKA